MRRPLSVACLLFLLPSAALAQKSSVPPEALLAGDSVVYLRFDGLEPHRSAYEQTALAQVMKGDAGEFAQELVKLLEESVGVGIVKDKLLAGLPPEQLVKVHQAARHLPRLLEYLQQHGFALGVEVVNVMPPRAQLTVVFPQAGQQRHREAIFAALQLVAELNDLTINESKYAGRTIYRLDTRRRSIAKTSAAPPLPVPPPPPPKSEPEAKPPAESEVKEAKPQPGSAGKKEIKAGEDNEPTLSWWQEGDHVVLTFGTEKPDHLLTLLAGPKARPNLTSNPLFRSVAGFDRFESLARGFVDLEQGLRKIRTLGPPAELILNQLGLAGLKNLTFHSGFAGRHQQTSIVLNLTGERKGVLQLIPSAEVTPERLPALPPDALTVTALSVDARAWADTARLIKQVVDMASGGDGKDLFAEIDTALGIDVRKDILDTLDTTAILYSSPGEGFTFLGAGAAIRVKDPKKLKVTLETLQKALAADEMGVRKNRYQGVDLYTFRTGERGFPMAPTWGIHGDWLVAGLNPPTVKGHILRSTGKYSSWKPPALLGETLAELKKNPRAKVLAFSATDPRASLKQAVALGQIFLSAFSRFQEDKIDPTRLPHFQSLTEPMSANVMIVVDEGDALRLEMKGSMPLPTDVLGMDSTLMLMLFGLNF